MNKAVLSREQGKNVMMMTATTTKRVLVVDDDDDVRRVHARILARAGLEVDTAENGRAALQRISTTEYSAVVTDIRMPVLDGMAFLRAVREINLDLPVMLITGAPNVTTAAEAVQYGAFRYLPKPVPSGVLVGAVSRAARLYDWAKLRRETRRGQDRADAGDRAAVEGSLTRALKAMWMAYQPIVSYRTKEVFAYEALMRTTEPLLPDPAAVIDAAMRLSRHEHVGQRVRRLVAASLDTTTTVKCFVNLHVRDLNDESLYHHHSPLSRHAARVVLELTERSPLDQVKGLRTRIERLKEMGYRIAVDNLGAGYAGLSSIAQLAPDFIKADMSLVRDIDHDEVKQKLVATLVGLSRDLDTKLVAEGVETPAERDQLLTLGCDLFQGYLFARPAQPFGDVIW